MTAFVDPAPGSYRRWFIFAFGSLNFVLSMFYRVSTAVISPALVRDMNLTSGQLGDLSAAFYYAFAFSQVPLGIAIDRLGPRLTIACSAVPAVAGAVVFALGETSGQLILGRALLGIGMSGNMVVILTLLAAWFPVNRFAFLSGTAVSVGVLGNLLAATPLALLSVWLGWRGSFLLFAAINAVTVTAFAIVVRDHPKGAAPARTKSESVLSGLGTLAHMYSYWAISLSNFIRYGYFAALQSLWIGPFLIFGIGLEEVAAGNALLALGIGYMAGLPIWGTLSDRILRSRKNVALPTMVAFCLVILSILWWGPEVPSWVLLGTCFLLGFTAGPGQILYAHIKELVPPAIIARAMTSVNFFTIIGVAAMIHVLGYALGQVPSSVVGPEPFHPLWYVGVACVGFVCILYAFVPDSQALKRKKR
jgi:MFS family permease